MQRNHSLAEKQADKKAVSRKPAAKKPAAKPVEVLGQDISQEAVDFRVKEWKERLDDLYSRIMKWLPKGYSWDDRDSVVMNEELMKKFKVPAIKLAVLKIMKGKETVLTFKPKGLWVIGANGRVDVYCSDISFMLVDMAERFSGTDWRLVQPLSTGRFLKLSKDVIAQLLNDPSKLIGDDLR